MTLNNSKSVINLKIIRRISTILYLTFLLLVFAAQVIRFPVLGIGKLAWALLFTSIFLVIMIVPQILNYQYIHFSDEGESIIFRYYTTGIIQGNKNSVEINKKTFSGFTVNKKIFGLSESITLYQRLREGVAKYPPIYLSGLKREDKEKIKASLNSFAPIIRS